MPGRDDASQTCTRRPPKSVPKDKHKQDEAIIGTNDYSIVSKRSVEKLYFPHEPQFLKSFVSKFKRRAPLINRGYWLRMKAIETAVVSFLREETSKSKVVVNLGCGYEPLPFRMLWKFPELCEDVKFVDVDFPQLITRKVGIILDEPLFVSQMKDAARPQPGRSRVAFDHDKYCAVGCDLGSQEQLQEIFHQLLDLKNRSVLFVGEVSIVYMPPLEADDLIHMCGAFDDARFCLLEQHLPAGPEHPFARTMLDHFSKQTPLRGLLSYPTIQSQLKRFKDAGWLATETIDLWSLWQDRDFLSDEERMSLDYVEPFDEWEGLALFAGHYFLLIATNSAAVKYNRSGAHWSIHEQTRIREEPSFQGPHLHLLPFLPDPGRQGGAILNLNSESFAHVGGCIKSSSQGAYEIYSRSESQAVFALPDTLHHATITSCGDGRSLLAGGRKSPTKEKTNPKCWMLRDDHWKEVADLKPARYRHCAVPVTTGGRQAVLIFGGCTGGAEVLNSWKLFVDNDWIELEAEGDLVPPLFGSTMANFDETSGILVGGMGEDRRLAILATPGYWIWKLLGDCAQSWKLITRWHSAKDSIGRPMSSIFRFGAQAFLLDRYVLVVGGIGPRGPLQREEEVLLIQDLRDRHQGKTVVDCVSLTLGQSLPFPMFVSHCVHRLANKTAKDDLVIVGGGTVCFSFGSYWNEKSWRISVSERVVSDPEWRLLHSSSPDSATEHLHAGEARGVGPAAPKAHVERLDGRLALPKAFSRSSRAPIVIENLHLGSATQLWTPEYLIEKVGAERPTVVHSAGRASMSFRQKNFAYETTSFKSFVESAARNQHVYLRALSSEEPSKKAADLETDFPGLAGDFAIPEALAFAKEHQHSSVLRITGDVKMWLHYDVMSNILCQIKGSKRILMFPPRDVAHLGFPPGETTSSTDPFQSEFDGAGSHPLEALLREGDVLFIPACWPHATAPAGADLSVAVNIFFRSFDDKLYAAGRDVYGNRDLAMYENGRRDIAKILSLVGSSNDSSAQEVLSKLGTMLRKSGTLDSGVLGAKEVNRIVASARAAPSDVAQFYLDRLAEELAASSLARIS